FFPGGVPNLHGAAADLLRLGRQLVRGKRGALDAIAPRPASDRSNVIPGARLLVAAVHGNQADGPTEYQRIGQITVLEADRTVDGRNTDAVTIIADPGHDAFHDLARVQDSRRQRLGRRVGRREAEDVRVANRLRSQPRAEWITDHAAQTGVGPAIRLDRRGVIV